MLESGDDMDSLDSSDVPPVSNGGRRVELLVFSELNKEDGMTTETDVISNISNEEDDTEFIDDDKQQLLT